MRKQWTQQDDRRLRDLHLFYSNVKIADMFDVSLKSVENRITRLIEKGQIENIKKQGGRGHKWSEEQDEYLKKWYGVIEAWKISEKLGRSTPAVYHRARALCLDGNNQEKLKKRFEKTPYNKWVKIRKQVYLRDGNKCRLCGYEKHYACHHILPRSKGGSDNMDNLITLCPNHHAEADSGELNANDLRKLII